ncbi:ABC transporter permease [Fervidibacillus halotolerans]|uniref:ABC transporter permease n=1 Tax=Fervidibacillus halotolerans TaxID=2980027 RepID=A0A9E8M164_9BACI|nr:ABC transporter permease [Fervidibacillus halotolerans]WAA13633.1 ABC transporter permease [Fervidibacillus halotolerans]
MKRFNNPVLSKEFKLRFRSGKSYIGLLFYLLALGILVITFIFAQSFSSQFGFFHPRESQWMFYYLSFLQLGLILFMTPGLTAGIISGEREKQTLNILLTTPQSSLTIVLGKLLSSISYLLILLFSSLPIYSFVFIYGGISPSQLVTVFMLYLITIFAIGSFSILFSTIIRKTIPAMVTSYALMVFFSAGTGILLVLSMMIGTNLSPPYTTNVVSYIFASLNPFVVMLSILNQEFYNEINQLLFNIHLPPWVTYVSFYLFIFLISIFVSVKKIRPNIGR